MTFINEFSRKTWIYFMKTKGEALSHSRAFKVDTKEDQGAEDKQLG